MLYTEPYNTFESGLRNARNVLSLEWLYDGLKHFLGKFFLLLLLFFVALPFVFLFGFWLQRKRKKFQKHMRKDFLDFKDSKNYKELKTYLKTLEELKPGLKKVGGYNYKKTPFFLKYTLGQMKKMSSTLVTYTEWLKGRLEYLNVEQFKGESKEFKFLPEKELWDKRNKAYQYWM